MNDVNFFQMNRIIDYSLLLGVIDVDAELEKQDLAILQELSEEGKVFYSADQQKAYMIGIIDYFQMYTWEKFMEKWTKRIIKVNMNLDTSSQPSGFYAKRFVNYMNRILK